MYISLHSFSGSKGGDFFAFDDGGDFFFGDETNRRARSTSPFLLFFRVVVEEDVEASFLSATRNVVLGTCFIVLAVFTGIPSFTTKSIASWRATLSAVLIYRWVA